METTLDEGCDNERLSLSLSLIIKVKDDTGSTLFSPILSLYLNI